MWCPKWYIPLTNSEFKNLYWDEYSKPKINAKVRWGKTKYKKIIEEVNEVWYRLINNYE